MVNTSNSYGISGGLRGLKGVLRSGRGVVYSWFKQNGRSIAYNSPSHTHVHITFAVRSEPACKYQKA